MKNRRKKIIKGHQKQIVYYKKRLKYAIRVLNGYSKHKILNIKNINNLKSHVNAGKDKKYLKPYSFMNSIHDQQITKKRKTECQSYMKENKKMCQENLAGSIKMFANEEIQYCGNCLMTFSNLDLLQDHLKIKNHGRKIELIAESLESIDELAKHADNLSNSQVSFLEIDKYSVNLESYKDGKLEKVTKNINESLKVGTRELEMVTETLCSNTENPSSEDGGESQDYWAPMINDSDNNDTDDDIDDDNNVEPNKNNNTNYNDDDINNYVNIDKKNEQNMNSCKYDMYLKRNEMCPVKENCETGSTDFFFDENNQNRCDDNYNNEENEIIEKEINIQHDQKNEKEYEIDLLGEKMYKVSVPSSEEDSEIKQISISEIEFENDNISSSKNYNLKLDKHHPIQNYSLKEETSKDFSLGFNFLESYENTNNINENGKELRFRVLEHKDIRYGKEFTEGDGIELIGNEKEATIRKVTETANSIIKDLFSYIHQKKPSLATTNLDKCNKSKTYGKNESLLQKETSAVLDIQHNKENEREYKDNMKIMSPIEDKQRISDIKQIHSVSEMEFVNETASSSKNFNVDIYKLNKDCPCQRLIPKDETSKELLLKENNLFLLEADEDTNNINGNGKESTFCLVNQKSIGYANEYNENNSFRIIDNKKESETADSIINDLLSYIHKSKTSLETEISNENVHQESKLLGKDEALVQKETRGASFIKNQTVGESNVENYIIKSLNNKKTDDIAINFNEKKKGLINEKRERQKFKRSVKKVNVYEDSYSVKSKKSKTKKGNIASFEKVTHGRWNKRKYNDRSKLYGDYKDLRMKEDRIKKRNVFLLKEGRNKKHRSDLNTENESRDMTEIDTLCKEESKMLITSENNSVSSIDDLVNKKLTDKSISNQELEKDMNKKSDGESSGRRIQNLEGYNRRNELVTKSQISLFIEDIRCTKDNDKSYNARSPGRNYSQKKYMNNTRKKYEIRKKVSVFKRLGLHSENSKESKKNPSEKNIHENQSKSVNKEKLINDEKKNEKEENKNDYHINTLSATSSQISSLIEDIRGTKDYEKSYKARSPDRNSMKKNDMNDRKNNEMQKNSSVFKRLGSHYKISENTSKSGNKEKLSNPRKKTDIDGKQNDCHIKKLSAASKIHQTKQLSENNQVMIMLKKGLVKKMNRKGKYMCTVCHVTVVRKSGNFQSFLQHFDCHSHKPSTQNDDIEVSSEVKNAVKYAIKQEILLPVNEFQILCQHCKVYLPFKDYGHIYQHLQNIECDREWREKNDSEKRHHVVITTNHVLDVHPKENVRETHLSCMPTVKSPVTNVPVKEVAKICKDQGQSKLPMEEMDPYWYCKICRKALNESIIGHILSEKHQMSVICWLYHLDNLKIRYIEERKEEISPIAKMNMDIDLLELNSNRLKDYQCLACNLLINNVHSVNEHVCTDYHIIITSVLLLAKEEMWSAQIFIKKFKKVYVSEGYQSECSEKMITQNHFNKYRFISELCDSGALKRTISKNKTQVTLVNTPNITVGLVVAAKGLNIFNNSHIIQWISREINPGTILSPLLQEQMDLYVILSPLLQEQMDLYDRLVMYLTTQMEPEKSDKWKVLLDARKFMWPKQVEGWAKVFGDVPDICKDITSIEAQLIVKNSINESQSSKTKNENVLGRIDIENKKETEKDEIISDEMKSQNTFLSNKNKDLATIDVKTLEMGDEKETKNAIDSEDISKQTVDVSKLEINCPSLPPIDMKSPFNMKINIEEFKKPLIIITESEKGLKNEARNKEKIVIGKDITKFMSSQTKRNVTKEVKYNKDENSISQNLNVPNNHIKESIQALKKEVYEDFAKQKAYSIAIEENKMIASKRSEENHFKSKAENIKSFKQIIILGKEIDSQQFNNLKKIPNLTFREFSVKNEDKEAYLEIMKNTIKDETDTLWISLSNVLDLCVNSSYCCNYFPSSNCKTPILMKSLVENITKESYNEVIKWHFNLLTFLGENSAFVMVPSIPQKMLKYSLEPKNVKVHNMLHSCTSPPSICSPDINTKTFIDTVNMLEEDMIKAAEDLMKIQGLHSTAISNYVAKKIPVIEILQNPSEALFQGLGNNFMKWQMFMAAFIRQMKTETVSSEKTLINKNLKKKIIYHASLKKDEDEKNLDEDLVDFELKKAEENIKSVKVVEKVHEEITETCDKESDEKNKVKASEKENYIFLGGLNKYSTCKNSLLNYFCIYGEILSIAIPSPDELHSCLGQINKGFAFVYFKSVKSLEKVLNITTHMLDGKVIGVRTTFKKKGSDKLNSVHLVAFAVPTELIGKLIGKGGNTISQIQITSGASLLKMPNTVSFLISGKGEQIECAKMLINKALEERSTRIPTYFVTEELDTGSSASKDDGRSSVLFYFALENCGLIIGKGGCTIKNIRSQSGASVTQDHDRDIFSLKGSAEQIDDAKKLVTQALKGYDIKFFRNQCPPQSLIKKISHNLPTLVEPSLVTSDSVLVSGDICTYLMSKYGSDLSAIKIESGAICYKSIKFWGKSDEETIKIKGTAQQISCAKRLLNNAIDARNMELKLDKTSDSSSYSVMIINGEDDEAFKFEIEVQKILEWTGLLQVSGRDFFCLACLVHLSFSSLTGIQQHAHSQEHRTAVTDSQNRKRLNNNPEYKKDFVTMRLINVIVPKIPYTTEAARIFNRQQSWCHLTCTNKPSAASSSYNREVKLQYVEDGYNYYVEYPQYMEKFKYYDVRDSFLYDFPEHPEALYFDRFYREPTSPGPRRRLTDYELDYSLANNCVETSTSDMMSTVDSLSTRPSPVKVSTSEVVLIVNACVSLQDIAHKLGVIGASLQALITNILKDTKNSQEIFKEIDFELTMNCAEVKLKQMMTTTTTDVNWRNELKQALGHIIYLVEYSKRKTDN